MADTGIPTHPLRSRAWLPTYLLANAVLSALPILLNIEWPAATGARLFVGVALASQMGLAMGVLCGLPGWLLGSFRPLQAWVLPVVVAASTLWWIAILVDARVFHQFGFHLNGLVIALMLNGGLLGQLGLTPGACAVAAVVVAGLATAQYLLARRLRRGRGSRLQARWLAVLLPLLVLTHALGVWYDARGRADAMAGLRAIPWLHTATARRHMVAWGWANEDPSRGWLAEQPTHRAALQYPRVPLQCSAQQPMNVLMIVVDSLRHDMLTAAQMPHTSRFATAAWQAEQHYSTGNNTMHGLFGLFYGLPALHTNTMIHHRRGPELLRQLGRYGYAHHLYGGASLQGARMDRAVFVDTPAPLHTAPDNVPQDRRDRHVVGQMIAALDAQPADHPFFGFVLLDSAHTPYAVPVDVERRFLPQAAAGAHLKAGRATDPTPLFNRYRNAVLKADALIGRLLQALEDSGRGSDTVVIITSDHGESFNDLGQNDWGHNSNFSDVQTRVPMLVRWPGRAPARESAVTSHMDIAPTLMRHLLSCANPPADYAAGLDLFGPLPASRPLLVESWTGRAVRIGPHALLIRPYGIEVRDADYRQVQETGLATNATAAIIDQMQLLGPSPMPLP
ncbi:MAG: sulfatase-like hydrolase/transferase [Stenotrophomonas sp.]